jgi:histidinol-phosphate aminotransferase
MTATRYTWQPTSAEIAARYGLTPDRIVRFDQNTAPFPTRWTPPIIDARSSALNDYPAASYRPLREAAARYTGVEPANVVPGAGADELIILAARAFLQPGERAVGLTPTYPLYRIATEQRGAVFDAVPGDPVGDPDAELTWLCLPNNPTGTRITDEAVTRILDAATGVVVIDAAYGEFTGDRWAPWIERYDRLLVLHTLSKGFGLAGIRVGYAIGNPALIDAIDGIRPPGSVSTLSEVIAIDALDHPERMSDSVRRIVAERERLMERLIDLGYDVPPSHANFLLAHIGPDAADLASGLMREGLVVREFPHMPELAEHLRFTIRSGADNDRLVETIERIRT